MPLSPARLLAGLLAALALLAAALPAAAQPAATPAGQARALLADSPAARALQPGDLDRLIATLESDSERARLLAELRALRAVRAGLPKPPPAAAAADEAAAGAGRPLGGLVAGALAQARAYRAKLAAQFAAPGPEAVTPARLAAVLADPARRAALLVALAQVVGALAAAWALAYGLHWGLRGLRDRLATAAAGLGWRRPGPLLARDGVALLGPAAFILAALAAGALLGLSGRAAAFLESLAAALGAGALAQTLAKSLLAPGVPEARLVPVGEAAAAWLARWLRRAVLVAVAGFVAGEALAILDYPVALAELARKLGGTAVVVLAVAACWRGRKAVAARLAPPADAPAGPGRRLRSAFARLWHVLAIAYLAAGYGVWALDLPGGLALFLRGSAVTALALLGAHLLAGLGAPALAARLRAGPGLAAHVPSLPERLARLRPVLVRAARLVAYLAAAVAILYGWGLGLPGWLRGEVLRTAGEVAFLLALFALAWEVLRSAIEWYLLRLDTRAEAQHRAARARTILPFLRNAGFIALATLAALSVLLALGINIAPLLAGAGVVGIAIGFGAQTLVKDIITGLFIMVENQIEVGDWVALANRSGMVEGLTIRTIRLRDLEGTVHTVPFSQVAEVANYTRDFAYAFVEPGFAYGEDIDRAIRLMEAVAAEMQAEPALAPHIYGELEMFGLERFEASAVVVRARLRVAPATQWWLRREFLARLKKHCEAAGVEIPLPHTKLYFGEAKQGRTPPARLAWAESGDAPPAESGAPGPTGAWRSQPGGD